MHPATLRQLKQFGIDSYYPRQQRQTQLTSAWYQLQLTTAGQQRWQLVADVGSAAQQDAEQRLLAAIAFALQGQLAAPAITQLNAQSELATCDTQLQVVLGPAAVSRWMGPGASYYALRGKVHHLQQQAYLVSYALADLVNKPMLKPLLWQELRAALATSS